MKTPDTARALKAPLSQDLLFAARYYLGGRTGIIALAALIVAAGAALNWSWLMAAGIAPLLLSVLPCLAMCVLGVCMSRMSGTSCSAGAEAAKNAAPVGPSPPRVLPVIAASAERIEPARPEDSAATGMKTADLLQTQTPDERK